MIDAGRQGLQHSAVVLFDTKSRAKTCAEVVRLVSPLDKLRKGSALLGVKTRKPSLMFFIINDRDPGVHPERLIKLTT